MNLTINTLVRFLLAIILIIALWVFLPLLKDPAMDFFDKIKFAFTNDDDDDDDPPEHFDDFNKALRENRIKDNKLSVDEVNTVIGGLTYSQKLDWTGGEIHLLKSNIGDSKIYFFYYPGNSGISVFTGPTLENDDKIAYSYNDIISEYPIRTLNGRLLLEIDGWWIFDETHALSPLTGPDHKDHALPSKLRTKVEQVVP